MMHFSSISGRLLAVVGFVVVAGLVALAVIYGHSQERSILEENEAALVKVTDSVAEGLSAIMLQRHAKVGKEFGERLKTVEDALDYRLLRRDGTEAFVDNQTVEAVNTFIDDEEFDGRKNDPEPVQVVPADSPELKQVIAAKQPVFKYEDLPNGERVVTVFSPIRGGKKCMECHEDGAEVRGVVKLTTSLRAVEHDIGATWRLSAMLFGGALIAIGGLVYFIAHRLVVQRLNRISKAMEVAGTGNLNEALNMRSRDELGRMASSFNQMRVELQNIYQGLNSERSKLSTLIQGAKEGIVVTNAAGDIVLVNAAAEEILGKSEALMRAEGFLFLFDNEDWMRESLSLSQSDNAPRMLSWSGKVLSVKASTIRNEENRVIGSAALIRDITEEKRLEEELRRRSITDKLTGLYNRRHFDKTLETEFRRWQRYKSSLSVIMLDVDHFKRFNDTHGHECGDHVLISIGAVLRETADASQGLVMAFRYGGEELVLVAANTAQAAAARLAETLRKRISALVIDGLQVTVSIGVAGTPEQVPETPEALLKLADEALYAAKTGGRNRVGEAPVAAVR